MRISTKIALSGVSLISLSAPAFAQDAADKKTDEDVIVVTGSLIRGTQVTGSQTIAVQADAIAQQAPTSTNQVLALIPQIANRFNGRFEADTRSIKVGATVNRINLRNLPGLTAETGNTTLVLMDGFRIAPVGVNLSAVDVDTIPAAVLEGVDVVTDGGSSLYGADGVAGVVNFRTKRKFEGVKIDANFGFGDTLKHYSQWDGNIMAGKSWSTGNAYISIGHSSRDYIANSETSWANGIRYRPDGSPTYIGTQCPNPVGTTHKWVYISIPGVFTGWTDNPRAGAGSIPTGTPCDSEGARVYLPKAVDTHIFGAFTQELADNIDLRVTAYWTKRDSTAWDFPRGYTFTNNLVAPVGAPGSPGAPASSPYSVPEGVGFSFSTNPGYVNAPNRFGFTTWGVTPELTVKLKGDWELRTTAYYGESYNYSVFPEVNNVAAKAAILSGTLDPLHADQAAPSVVQNILNWETVQHTVQALFDVRTIADGPLFDLPGGQAKIAVGLEYQDNLAQNRLNTGMIGSVYSLPFRKVARNSKSAFAELSLPVTTFLDLTASVRYDNYSDFGGTTNPNLGFKLKPVDWLQFFGHWNKSFNAPTPIDSLPLALGRQGGIIYCGGCSPVIAPTDPQHLWGGTGTKSIVLEGPGIGIKPQTADTWALGFSAKPLPGLEFGAEYYNIHFKNVIGTVDVTDIASYTNFPQFFHFSGTGPNNLTLAQYNDLLSQLGNGDAIKAQIPFSDVATIVDRRTNNLSNAELEGIDFHLNYTTNTGFGEVAFGVNGNVQTHAVLQTASFRQDTLGLNGPEFTATSFLMARTGGLTGKVTVNYSGRFHDGDVDYLGNEVIARPFVTTDLFLGYDFGETGPLAGTSLHLNVDNALNEKPQYVMRAPTSFSPSFVNWTLGRVIKFGFTKKI